MHPTLPVFDHYDAIIVGAGIAGLKAAYDLRQAGKRVVVLEARERIGGRIWSVSAGGVPVELGAEIVHGARVATWSLIDALHVRSAPLAAERFRHEGAWLDAGRYARVRGIAGGSATALAGQRAPRSGESVDQYLAASGFVATRWPLALQLAALDWERASRCAASEWFGTPESSPPRRPQTDVELSLSGDFCLASPYRRLLDPLAADIEIVLNAIVQRIDYSAAGGPRQASVHFQRAGTERQLAARCIVVTVPLGVLKHGAITFEPPLPAMLRQAIGALDMVSASKMIHVFDTPVMPEGVGLLVDFEQSPAAWWINTAQAPGDAPQALVGWSAGDSARALLALPVDQAGQQSLQTLQRMLARPALRSREFVTHDWQADRFARGAYSFLPAGAPADSRRTLAEPVAASLFWAGEATHPERFATVDGAFDSGRRVALQVLGRLAR